MEIILQTSIELSKESNIYFIKYRRVPNIQPLVPKFHFILVSHMTCCLRFCTACACILEHSTPTDLFVGVSHTTVDVTLFICISDLCLYCTYSTEIVFYTFPISFFPEYNFIM
jgi:hypothetical protein